MRVRQERLDAQTFAYEQGRSEWRRESSRVSQKAFWYEHVRDLMRLIGLECFLHHTEASAVFLTSEAPHRAVATNIRKHVPTDQELLKWVEFHMSRVLSREPISGPSKVCSFADLRDGRAYILVLHPIAPVASKRVHGRIPGLEQMKWSMQYNHACVVLCEKGRSDLICQIAEHTARRLRAQLNGVRRGGQRVEQQA